MKAGKREFQGIWLLLAGFCAAAGAVLVLCLTTRAQLPDTVGRRRRPPRSWSATAP